MKLCDCLPNELSARLLSLADMRELRIRNGCAVKINVSGRWYYLGKNGSLQNERASCVIVGNICDEIVKRVCSNSVYAYEKSLARGYFTLEDGVRVGVCGPVSDSDRSVFKQFTSLCFRIPHCVNCATSEMISACESNDTIIIGAPSSGKTTYLRDIAYKLGQRFNVLVCDERGELFYDDEVAAGSCCDVLKWASKSYAFECGVRAMSPQYFICDELNESDSPFVASCVSSGVKLICSAHASCLSDFERRFALKKYFANVIDLNKNSDILKKKQEHY